MPINRKQVCIILMLYKEKEKKKKSKRLCVIKWICHRVYKASVTSLKNHIQQAFEQSNTRHPVHSIIRALGTKSFLKARWVVGKTIKHLHSLSLYSSQYTVLLHTHTSSFLKYKCSRMNRLAFLQKHVAFRLYDNVS